MSLSSCCGRSEKPQHGRDRCHRGGRRQYSTVCRRCSRYLYLGVFFLFACFGHDCRRLLVVPCGHVLVLAHYAAVGLRWGGQEIVHLWPGNVGVCGELRVRPSGACFATESNAIFQE